MVETPNTGTRKATLSFVPSTLNEEARTVEIVWATETRVRRRSWDGAFDEELSLSAAHVRMGRFTSGRAPVLVEHNSWSPNAHVGVIESARIEGRQGIARVRFLKDDPDADKAWNKVRQGVLASISVGYRIHKFEKVEGGDGKTPVFRATDWEPVEASLVAMPADPASHIRSADERNTMEPEKNEQQQQQTPEQIRAEERERVADITKLFEGAGRRLPTEYRDQLISRGVSVPDARKAVIDALADMSDAEFSPTPGFRSAESRGDWQALRGRNVPHTPSVTGSQHGSHDDFRAAAVDALVMRAGIQMDRPHAAARDLRHTPAVEIARTCLSRAGQRGAGLSASETIKRAFSTSDFPQILSGAIGVSVRRGYETEPSSHRQWVHVESVSDLRDQLRPILGSSPDLDQLPELAEYRHGSLTEDATSFRVLKYGKALSLSWELLVNDQLSAFLRVKPALGQAARRKEADLVYSMFAENSGAGPTLQDGKTLWHADHKNTVAGGLDVAGLGAARTLLRKQTAVGGGYLALAPRFILLPCEAETEADILLASATRTKTDEREGDRPDWIGRLIPVIEPRLAAGAYYLLADSSQIDTVVLGLLDENMGGPVIEEEAEFHRDAYNMKVRHVAGAKVLDWRGMVRVKAP